MSDKPMTQEELATIRTIMGQTTPGNWYAYEDKAGEEFDIKSFDGGRKVVSIRNHSNQWNYGSDGIPRKENAIFLAMSKELVGRMLDEVERLREENKRLCGELERVHEEADWLAESLETESPYCDECEFKDEQYYDYGENVTWCAHAPDGTNDTCDQSWRKAARKAIEEERNDE